MGNHISNVSYILFMSPLQSPFLPAEPRPREEYPPTAIHPLRHPLPADLVKYVPDFHDCRLVSARRGRVLLHPSHPEDGRPTGGASSLRGSYLTLNPIISVGIRSARVSLVQIKVWTQSGKLTCRWIMSYSCSGRRCSFAK